ncbi:MAG: MFS transporter [Amylibacter sp.]|nr:MFS transporter [Amylibacter sp.]
MTAKSKIWTPILIVSCLILMTGFAIRASFGVFQIPIASEFGWLRSEFSLAIAIQNLAWGIGQPIFAAIAEKFGDRRAIFLGALTYAAGLILSSVAITPSAHQLLEIMVGFGIAGTGFGVILAIVGRAASDENRSLVLGIATASGSLGQFIGPPIAAALLTQMNWSSVFLIFAVAILSTMLFVPFLRSQTTATNAAAEKTMSKILLNAVKDPTYTLIFLGFFSCGYQLGFITAHFPAFITEICGPISVGGALDSIGVNNTILGGVAIGIIGLTNIIGTVGVGLLGKHFPKKYLLAIIYTGRTLTSTWFIMMPMSPTTVVIFSVLMGFFWLATVPLTAGLIAHIYGLRYMGTLYGIVFFSHQLGSFLGVWLGGALHDIYGTYTLVWWIGIGVGAISAILHLPIREIPLKAQPA